ncbi:MAG TPA: DHA2 family efflux MFS transporter permease subunit [Solirubrobacterales bacterium]
MTATTKARATVWTLAITGAALFMTALDNLVVGVALPSIRADLGGSIESLEWTVNAYTLAFAVLLITGAALGDRFGRRRMFTIGLGIFTGASALAALAPSIEALIAARAIQGVGAAIVTPLTLTLVSEAVPPEKRGGALGIWGAISGLGVAVGPFVGGLVVEGVSWQWIFWLNVPVGLALLPLAIRKLAESRGPDKALDLPGLGLAAAGLFGLTFGIIRGEALGWTSAPVVTSIAAGLALLAFFVWWELRAREPMLPMRFFRSRSFSATNGLSFAMFFGTFGAIFLLSQFFQTAQGYGPLEAGLRTLPWTAMPMFVAPIAGVLGARFGTRPLMAAGLAMQAVALAWIGLISAVDTPFAALIAPFMLAGAGMALVFPTAAATVLASVRPEEAGKASGATNAIREIGGVMGVAVLATVFSANGGFQTPQAFTDGVVAALPVAVGVLAVGAVLALIVPARMGRYGHGGEAHEDVRDLPAKAGTRTAEPAPAPGAGM